jgi:hypothetical protein
MERFLCGQYHAQSRGGQKLLFQTPSINTHIHKHTDTNIHTYTHTRPGAQSQGHLAKQSWVLATMTTIHHVVGAKGGYRDLYSISVASALGNSINSTKHTQRIAAYGKHITEHAHSMNRACTAHSSTRQAHRRECTEHAQSMHSA